MQSSAPPPKLVVIARSGARKGAVTIRRQPEPANADVPPAPAARDRRSAADREFLPAAIEVIETPRSPTRLISICAICALFAAMLAWSYFGRLAVYAEVPGKIQATGRTKVIEPRQTGQVSVIRVRDGDHVKAGDTLIELDPTEAVATRTAIADKLISAHAEIARRRVEIAAARAEPVDTAPAVRWSDDIPQNVRQREARVLHANLAQLAAALAGLSAQRHAKEVVRDKFSATVAAEKSLISTISKYVAMSEQLARQGWNSQAKLLDYLATLRQAQTVLAQYEGSVADAIAAIAVIDSQIVKTRETFITQDTQNLATEDQQAKELTEQLAKASQAVDNMTLATPLSGVVQASAVTTVGQIVQPGLQLLQIVPDDIPLEIEGYVQNTDIGFIKQGQGAEIKVDAFPYTTYSSIPGTVTKVANDALPGDQKNAVQTASLDGAASETTAAQKTASMVFPITVAASRPAMRVDGKDIPLSAGMTVTMDIKTEDRRAIDYIVSPLIDLFSTAAHER